MAKVPGPALLIAGAAALYFLSKKKDAPGAKKDSEPKIGNDNEEPDTKAPSAPKAKTQDELEEELGGEDDGEGGPTQEEIVAEAKWKVWPPGSQLSGSVGEHNVLFASEDCESALIGRDWNPVIEFEGKFYDPASFWVEFGDGKGPLELVEEIGSSQVNWYSRRLFDNNNAIAECDGVIPSPGDYEGDGYDNAWTALLNGSPALAKLYYQVYSKYVKPPMLAAWAAADPDAYHDYMLVEIAEWAVKNYPNEDQTEQTDQAYFYAISDDDAAPKVLDKNKPAHEPYIDLWLSLNQAIKNL